LLPDN